VLRPIAAPAPVVFDSPHSGRFYPPGWVTACSRRELRRGEDAYVDALVRDATSSGIPVLLARYPRCYIDLNRNERDLDPTLLAGPWPGPLEPGEKSLRGLGLIRRHIVPGVAVNARPLEPREVRRRLDAIYHPYHRELDALLESSLERHGVVWLVDWHSMKSVGNSMTPDGPGAARPDAVVGDGDGRSAAPAVTEAVVQALRDVGLDVAINRPYAGGEIVRRCGAPRAGIHCVQVELNRGLYLDEVAVRKTAGFTRLQQQLLHVAERVAARAREAASRG
jgi:N-formylglutamate amidohydrolase